MYLRISYSAASVFLVSLAFLAFHFCIPSSAHAATYLVRADGTGDFPTIQSAIDAAVNGDRVLLADGVFSGPGNRDLTYGLKAITIESEGGVPADCVIDCADPLAPHRGFLFDGEGPGSILRKIEIRNGRADFGGGIYSTNASPTITRCTLVSCSAVAQGGGIYVDGGSPAFSYCYALYCDAEEGGGAFVTGSPGEVYFVGGFADNQADFGAGLCVDDGGSAHLFNAAFVRNEATTYGGAVAVRNNSTFRSELTSFEDSEAATGGAVYTDHSSITLTDSWILRNHASHGAGIWCQNGSSPTLNRCVVAFNYAPGYGGGVHCWNSSPDIRSSTFYDNAAGEHGNGVSIEQCGLSLSRSIIAFGAEGEAVYCYEPDVISIECCDIYGNQGGDWTSYIAPFQDTEGNLRLDPRFCDGPGGDWTLEATSPCLPHSAPNPECDLIGAFGVGCPVSSTDEPLLTEFGESWLRVQPSPFRDGTWIRLNAAPTEVVRVSVFDAAGRLVRDLRREPVRDGTLEIEWDGRDQAGSPVGPGVYFVRAEAEDRSASRPVVLVR
ncbi:MAG: hypothetical protein KDA27_14695 [Candidatus Eisenbacteria bacterium]|uniref:FlgD/Vpr Ig-like domain-containing protein n=1 Tax=Eiseniibacteriota bacterium TaxID=2212470 RepID=A0A956NGM1_UNCEI|nr:hypothetical protein [Candidatus Eisenbacteria bacterium]